MKKKDVIILFLIGMVALTISMFISIYFVLRVEKKIDRFEYIVDNSNLESNIAIMVLDFETQEYFKSNTIPVGKYKLNKEKTHCVGKGILKDYNADTGTIRFETEAADECYLYFDEYQGAFNEILNNYTGQGMAVGNGKLYLHDSSLENGANDGSYRYAGADPDNYLCFQGDVCDDAHKYRIIGIFGENIKVIKMTSTGNKQWNSNNLNTWENSTMDTYLNNEWLTSFGHSDLIEDYDWHVGGHNAVLVTAKVMYDGEIRSNLISNRKVGLMYASDYGYGVLNDYWTTNLPNYNSSAQAIDWLKLGATEWTISPHAGSPSNVCYASGVINGTFAANSYATRPCFYLKPSVDIKNGTGTKTDPWIMG